ncbi:MAG: DoxX family membrane protein [Ignavibacteriae bacterium]|nr:DoxX family membrane protein [Ignavibacteriota bacterium]
MKTILNNPILALAIRLVLGCIFIFAAAGKIADPDTFAKSISNYHLIPNFALNIMALTMPWIELLTGIFLIIGVRLRASSAIISGMLIIFLIAIISAILRGYNIDCGCFAQTSQSAAATATKVGWKKVLEDTAMLVGGLYIFFFPNKHYTFDSFAHNESGVSQNTSIVH